MVSKRSFNFVDPDEMQLYAAAHLGVWWGGVFRYVYRYIGLADCFIFIFLLCVCVCVCVCVRVCVCVCV